MSEIIGSFEMINVVEASCDKDKSGDIVYSESALTGNTNQYKVLTIEKSNHNSSGIWNYFGIAKKENPSPEEQKYRRTDKILCLICFQTGHVHSYKRSTSSGNLWRHLHKKHNIPIPKERVVETAIKFHSMNGVDYKCPEKFLIEQNNNTLLKSKLNVSNVTAEPSQKVGIINENGVKCNEEIFKDIGSLLISEVAKRPALYRRYPPSFGRKFKRDILWQEVWNALDRVLDIDHLQKMWTNISDRYKKLKNMEQNGITEVSYKYKYYNQLKFLDYDEIIEDTILDTTIDSNEEFDEILNKEVNPSSKKAKLEDISEIILKDSTTSHNGPPNDIGKTIEAVEMFSSTDTFDNFPINSTTSTTITVDDNKLENKMYNSMTPIIAPSPTTTDTNVPYHNSIGDEFDLFGRFIAEKLRRIPRYRIDDIEIKILQLITNESNMNIN